MAPALTRAALAALLLAALPARASSAVLADVAGALRGVHPDKKAAFIGVETFQCDGGKKHPISAFNDDYCDCSDGTDEPGARSLRSTETPGASEGRVFILFPAASQARRRARTASITAETGVTCRRQSSRPA